MRCDVISFAQEQGATRNRLEPNSKRHRQPGIHLLISSPCPPLPGIWNLCSRSNTSYQLLKGALKLSKVQKRSRTTQSQDNPPQLNSPSLSPVSETLLGLNSSPSSVSSIVHDNPYPARTCHALVDLRIDIEALRSRRPCVKGAHPLDDRPM